MNSYFASVEQQARPALRGKPIAVTGSDKKRTIIVAASVEAKKFAVKTGTQIYEAKKLCPEITMVVADCGRYEAITRQFLKIFISKTPLVEIFSIDEAFLDLSGQTKNLEEAGKLAREIKAEIKSKIGVNIRCSIGIAQNKFMAKLASEAHKPDGLTVVFPGREIEFLDQFGLTDACGIGRGISRRLALLGVNSFSDLRKIKQTALTLAFNSYGLRLYNMARGQDLDPVRPYFLCSKPKSISRSKTLQFDTYDISNISKIILSFCENIGAELRFKKLLAGSIGVYLRYKDFSWGTQGKTIKNQTSATAGIYSCAKRVLSQIEVKKPVRKIGVWAGGLSADRGQLCLGGDFGRAQTLDEVADFLNKKYGDLVIRRSSLTNLGFSGRSPNFGFKKEYELES